MCGTEKEGAKGKVNDTPREGGREREDNHPYSYGLCNFQMFVNEKNIEGMKLRGKLK